MRNGLVATFYMCWWLAGVCAGLLSSARPMCAEDAQAVLVVSLDGMEITGAVHFKPDDIARQLRGANPLRIIADNPLPPRTLDALEKAIIDGYHVAGFPDVKAAASLDPAAGNVKVRIVEGPRIVAGRVIVEGEKIISAETLRQLAVAQVCPREGRTETLKNGARRFVDADDQVVAGSGIAWRPGKPLDFRADAAKEAQREITSQLARLGYPRTEVACNVVIDRKKKEADLEVKVLREEPIPPFDKVNVFGDTRESGEDLARYLGLTPRDLLTGELAARCEHRLWQSGRFEKVEASASEVFGKGILRVYAKDYDKAPRLNEPLSHAEEVMLSMARWLRRHEEWNSDVVCTVADADDAIEVVVSSDGGMMLTATSGAFKPADRAAPAPPGANAESEKPKQDSRFIVTLRQAQLAIYNIKDRKKFIVPLLGAQPKGECSFKFNQADEKDHPYLIGFGFGVRSIDADQQGAPFVLAFRPQPVAVLSLVHHDKPQCESANGILTLDSKRHIWRVEEATGRLIECVFKPSSTEDTTVRLFTKQNALKDRLREVENLSVAWADVSSPLAPAESAPYLLDSDASRELRETMAKESALASVWRILSFVLNESAKPPSPDAEFNIP